MTKNIQKNEKNVKNMTKKEREEFIKNCEKNIKDMKRLTKYFEKEIEKLNKTEEKGREK